MSFSAACEAGLYFTGFVRGVPQVPPLVPPRLPPLGVFL